MKPLYTQLEFNEANSKTLLPCECYNCNTEFLLTKKRIKDALNPNCNDKGMFCSMKCMQESQKTRAIINCHLCKRETIKHVCNIKKDKLSFCSNSCRTKHYNQHKTWGSNRSKLEKWVEERLTELYPSLDIDYNNTDVIGYELDIYIPSLKLAFELNGIFHYEPIFGEDKLNETIKNDKNKIKICREQGISLCVIDTTEQTYFKPKKSVKYLNMITERIEPSLI